MLFFLKIHNKSTQKLIFHGFKLYAFSYKTGESLLSDQNLGLTFSTFSSASE